MSFYMDIIVSIARYKPRDPYHESRKKTPLIPCVQLISALSPNLRVHHVWSSLQASARKPQLLTRRKVELEGIYLKILPA